MIEELVNYFTSVTFIKTVVTGAVTYLVYRFLRRLL